jgi:hypothetical protein
VKDPHYVTTFTFFGHPPAGHEGRDRKHGPTTFYVNATPAVQRLQAAGLFKEDEPLRLTLVAVDIDPKKKAEGVRVPFKRVTLSAHN